MADDEKSPELPDLFQKAHGAKSTLAEAMCTTAIATENILEPLLSVQEIPDIPIGAAMRYGCLNGGKRLRPFLLIESAGLFGVSSSLSLRVAAALEILHCYSLIHDDLPAMDDDDLRRGQPTLHKAFDEATAILAGDALLTLAFEVLAHEKTHEDPAIRNILILELAQAAGARGMVGGQMLDLAAEKRNEDFSPVMNYENIKRLQTLKTGKLFNFACKAGAVLGRANEEETKALADYSANIGLAFQIADDLLDNEGSESKTGKAVGKDLAKGKKTFVSVLGIEQARCEAQRLVTQALLALSCFGSKADRLKELAYFIITRQA